MRMLSAVPTAAYAKSTVTSVPEIDQSTPMNATRVTSEFRVINRYESVPVVKFLTSSEMRWSGLSTTSESRRR